ncbi:hypothetical protein [Corynebacterium pilosum]|uniref:Uncharacterized protein n=1 Tax=Corynebacterium pilosum TaxID=35756 RepID=A0A376CNA9_9CORY|nr:hypothetical protein [Corynebacterium pilosum]STC69752.1 Uncharacterised protein [Corynebacterium pilosum]
MTRNNDHTFTVDPEILRPLISAVREDAHGLQTIGDVLLPNTRFCHALTAALARYDDASAALFNEANSVAESVETMISDAFNADADIAAGFERTLA